MTTASANALYIGFSDTIDKGDHKITVHVHRWRPNHVPLYNGAPYTTQGMRYWTASGAVFDQRPPAFYSAKSYQSPSPTHMWCTQQARALGTRGMRSVDSASFVPPKQRYSPAIQLICSWPRGVSHIRAVVTLRIEGNQAPNTPINMKQTSATSRSGQ